MPAFDVPSNLAFDNYSELVTVIADWMDRSDLSGVAQSMIALAEARMRRELTALLDEVSISLASDADGLVILPSDFGTVSRVIYNSYALPQLARGAAPLTGTGTVAHAYTIERGKLRLWPAGVYTVTVLYTPLIPFLSTANPTNDLLAAHPDLYFFGSMMFAEGYVVNDSRAATFKALWDEALAETRLWLMKRKYAAPLVPRVAFVP